MTTLEENPIAYSKNSTRSFETSYKNDFQVLDAQSAKFLRTFPLPSSPTRVNRPQPTKVFFISGVRPDKVDCQVWCPHPRVESPSALKTPLSTSQYTYTDHRYNQRESYKRSTLKNISSKLPVSLTKSTSNSSSSSKSGSQTSTHNHVTYRPCLKKVAQSLIREVQKSIGTPECSSRSSTPSPRDHQQQSVSNGESQALPAITSSSSSSSHSGAASPRSCENKGTIILKHSSSGDLHQEVLQKSASSLSVKEKLPSVTSHTSGAIRRLTTMDKSIQTSMTFPQLKTPPPSSSSSPSPSSTPSSSSHASYKLRSISGTSSSNSVHKNRTRAKSSGSGQSQVALMPLVSKDSSKNFSSSSTLSSQNRKCTCKHRSSSTSQHYSSPTLKSSSSGIKPDSTDDQSTVPVRKVRFARELGDEMPVTRDFIDLIQMTDKFLNRRAPRMGPQVCYVIDQRMPQELAVQDLKRRAGANCMYRNQVLARPSRRKYITGQNNHLVGSRMYTKYFLPKPSADLGSKLYLS